MKKNERLQALQVLLSVLQNKTPLSYVLKTLEATPFCKELCYGVLRYYIRLEAIATYFVSKKPKTKDLDVWLTILMGLYQLHDLKLPDYAVVQESVALLNLLKKGWAKGLVNAVLRNYCRDSNSCLSYLKDDSSFNYNHPQWLIEKLRKDWPNTWQQIIKENDKHPPFTLRVNSRKISRTQYLSRLHEKQLVAHPHDYAKEAIILSTPMNVQALPGFFEGDISVQDAAAQLAASLLDLKPDLRVLDACAAPGGKTCHMLECEPKLAEVVALDIDNKRLARVQDNLNRLQLNATLIQGDGQSPNDWWDNQPFDRILLDAPCSATGVIRRNPDIKLLRTPEEITVITHIQANLLRALWPLLAPGGLLVYATCSVMPEENEAQIARFIKEEAGALIIPIETNWGQKTTHGRQILPGEQDMDGFYYSVLQKI